MNYKVGRRNAGTDVVERSGELIELVRSFDSDIGIWS